MLNVMLLHTECEHELFKVEIAELYWFIIFYCYLFLFHYIVEAIAWESPANFISDLAPICFKIINLN